MRRSRQLIERPKRRQRDSGRNAGTCPGARIVYSRQDALQRQESGSDSDETEKHAYTVVRANRCEAGVRNQRTCAAHSAQRECDKA